MKALLLLTLLVAVSDFARASVFRCPGGCSYKCPVIDFSTCPYGKAHDACSCCFACAKGPGEICNPRSYECASNMYCAHAFWNVYRCKAK
ncbi:single insulin-like growth factor-binding domain protein-2 [Penaeus indicus]|uniref:single insulin-like growth factor-binding domain protein-2 n=1 Tax=Penaeus indicus TaxID=29960 RepID=UPI00300CD63B